MKITADLVSRAGQFLNALKERELDLRGYKIPAIENLGTTQMPRLSMLLLSNNRISRVADGAGARLPNLQTLVLTNNRIATLAEIDGLSSFQALTMLSLLQNPINRRKHYRLYVIHKIPTLRVLDFQKVRQSERSAAAELFASAEGRKLEAAVAKARSYTPSASAAGSVDGEGPFTPAQVVLIQQALAAASTPEEVDRLHRYLKAGKLPPDLARAEKDAAAAAGGGGGGDGSDAEEEQGTTADEEGDVQLAT